MRCATLHGPHSFSLLGPNNATTGVPIAAAMCIGAESTPKKSRARAESAAISRSVSFPEKSCTGTAASARMRAMIACARGSGAPVTTTWWPSRRRHRPARPQRLREPRAATMVREVHQHLVAPFLDLLQQLPFVPRLHREALALPGAIDDVDASDGGVARKHVARVGIDQRVDFRVRRVVLEHGEDGGGEQDIAVVAQFHHQGATHRSEVDGVGDHGPTGWATRRAPPAGPPR